MEKSDKNTERPISLCYCFKSMIPYNQHKEEKFYKNKDIYRSCHVSLKFSSVVEWVKHQDSADLYLSFLPALLLHSAEAKQAFGVFLKSFKYSCLGALFFAYNLSVSKTTA